MAYSALGFQCRDFLGPIMDRLIYPPSNGVSFGGVGRRDLERQGHQFATVPLPFVPVRPDFDLLLGVARSLDIISNLDDQRAYDAGVAAEYFVAVRASLAPAPASVPASPAAGSSASHGESDVDLALRGFSALPLARQEFMILSMMLANMTDEMYKLYQHFATPRDIFVHILRQQADALESRVPILIQQLHEAVIGSRETIDAFFLRVRGMCMDLRSAGQPQTELYAMGIIVRGSALVRFDSLRIKYNLMLYNKQPVDFWSCLEEYRQLDIINMALSPDDSRYPGWGKSTPQVPANAAFPAQSKQRGGGASGSNKRSLVCTYGGCKRKVGHTEDTCYAKYPELRPARPSGQIPRNVPANLALPAHLTRRQMSSLQSQVDAFALQK
jgi:hypothetical protein